MSDRLFYTVGELSTMAGVSPYRMRRLLRQHEVPVDPHARPGIVYVSSLVEAMPDLVTSIRVREGGSDE